MPGLVPGSGPEAGPPHDPLPCQEEGPMTGLLCICCHGSQAILEAQVLLQVFPHEAVQ